MGASLNGGWPTTPLTEAEKTDVRRYLDYEVYGTGSNSFDPTRYFRVYSQLEYRMASLQPAELQVTRQMLSDLYDMEQAITANGATLNIAVAAVYTRNRAELTERRNLFKGQQRKLATFLGTPLGGGAGGGGNTGMRII